MKSRIFVGKVMHGRKTPVAHEFTYPLYMYAFDLDELPTIQKEIPFFGYNKLGLVSIYDKDYLTETPGSIKKKLLTLLQSRGCKAAIKRIEFVTAARYFNYVFNPVSFYYCYGDGDTLHYTVAEINNTFGERHVYILDGKREPSSRFLAHYRVPKEFHVSPFYDLHGEYDFHFAPIDDKLDIRVNMMKGGKLDFVSRLWGETRELTTKNLLKTLFAYPLSAALTMPRILWQAGKLHYRKKLPVYRKPNPMSRDTIKVKGPSLLQRMGMRFVLPRLDCAKESAIALTMPDGAERIFGNPAFGIKARLVVHNYNFFRRIMLRGGVGLGESYVAGDWSSPDVTAFLKFVIDNRDHFESRSEWLLVPTRILDRLLHWRRKNTISGSQRNISEHYDLGNEFFSLFLDPSLMYSSAYFDTPYDTLEEAQHKKLRRIIEKSDLRRDDHVLEIGSGWGGFAVQAVKQTGCRVSTITLSEAQFEKVNERIRQENLQKKISVALCDYRNAAGRYDKIVSIEMLEAVGEEFLGEFFASCDKLLKPDGLLVLQAITMPEKRYDAYRTRPDWIQKYIFPGAHIPSLQAIMGAAAANGNFVLEHVENLAPHYARTLMEWRRRFREKLSELPDMGFDVQFQRTWDYYLSYCEAGFASRTLNVLQLVFSRPNNKVLRENERQLTEAPPLASIKMSA